MFSIEKLWVLTRPHIVQYRAQTSLFLSFFVFFKNTITTSTATPVRLFRVAYCFSLLGFSVIDSPSTSRALWP